MTGVKRRAMPLIIVMALIAALGVLIGTGGAGAAPRKALINASTVSGSPSQEEQVATDLGFAVTVVDDSTWASLTAADFGQYDLLIAGDPPCGSLPPGLVSSASVFGPVVLGTAGGRTLAGNRVAAGIDVVLHDGGDYSSPGARGTILREGIAYAGSQAGRTGMYFDTTCAANYYGQSAETLAILNAISAGSGSWTLDAVPPCGGSVSLIASNPSFADLTTDSLQGWGCSVHEAFPTFTSDWSALAVATDTTTTPTCGVDPGTGLNACGEAYILIAGSSIVVGSRVISVSPLDSTNPVGTSHTVTANVHAIGGSPPVVGQLVDFSVTGQNAGATGTCVPADCKSDVNGNVSFTYFDGAGAGDDTIKASFTDNVGSLQTATAQKHWASGPPLQLSIGNGKVFEGDAGQRIVRFPVTLSPSSTSPVTVDYTTTDGTGRFRAQAPLDYTARAGTLTFPAGSTSQQVSITLNGNTINEGTEYFKVKLSNPQGATLHDASGTGVILGDDPGAAAAHLDMGSAAVYEGESGSSVQVMVTLSKPSASPVSVHFATANDSATAPGDYTAVSGNLTFSPGQTSKAVTVPIAGDTTAEGPELFTIQLSAASGAAISNATGTVKIFNGI